MSSNTLADLKSFSFLVESMDAQHKLYVESRARGSTPVAAARMAGFRDPDVASMKLESDMCVRAAIEACVRVSAHKMQLTKRDVLEGFLDAVRISATATELTGAWREIGKLIGAYDPEAPAKEKEVQATREEIAGMTDEELAKHAAIEGSFEVLEFQPVKNAD